MARYDKVVDRLKRRPPEADFENVRRLLEAHGWQMRRGGKHTALFTKGGRLPLTIPTVRGKTVKRYIIDQVLTALDLND